MVMLFFGDSFVGIFKLLKNSNIKVYKYSGATIKGLTKNNNKNRKNIEKIINNYNIVNCCIFSFGQVDLHFSYYYKKFVKKERFMIKNMVENYLKFINSFDNCKNKIVIGIYPSAVNDHNIHQQLINYKAIYKNTKIDKKFFNHNFRHKLYTKFNKYLKDECKKYKIEFVDIAKIVLNNNNKVKNIYVDPINKYNVHLLWEPLIPKLLENINTCNIEKKYKYDLNKSLKDYLSVKTKRYKQLKKI